MAPIGNEEKEDQIRSLLEHFATRLQNITVSMSPESNALYLESLVNSFGHLLWLLGLCPEERQFVKDAAETPCDYAGLLIFADWLADKGRDLESGKISTLVPPDGGLLVFTPNPIQGTAREEKEKAARDKEMLKLLAEKLKSFNRNVMWVRLPTGAELDALSPDDLERLGWVRKQEWIDSLKNLQAQLLHEPEFRVGALCANAAAEVFARLKREASDARLETYRQERRLQKQIDELKEEVVNLRAERDILFRALREEQDCDCDSHSEKAPFSEE
jgi:hypothetical protein